MLLRYLLVMRLSGDEGCGDLLEGRVERFIVQKDPIVMVIPVEAVFYLPDRLDNIP